MTDVGEGLFTNDANAIQARRARKGTGGGWVGEARPLAPLGWVAKDHVGDASNAR